MDYAYAPLPDHGRNHFYSIYRRMFPHRPNTRLVSRRGFRRVEDYLDFLENDASVTRPIGNFIIATHGSDQGYIQMELDTVSHHDDDGNLIHGTTFEVLVNAITGHTIEIPDALINPRPDDAPEDPIFHIRGCNVGAARPFLEKFKEALGGNVLVSSPKQFDNNREMTRGAFEYLGYNYKIQRRDAFANRRQLVNAFRNQNPHFQFIDGTDVPDANWNRWIPNNIRPGQRNRTPKPYWNFGQQVERQRRFRLAVVFRHNFPAAVGRYTFTLGGVIANPGNNAARLQVLREELDNHPAFQPDHEFPEYERYGYENLQDFIDGYRWVFDWNRPNLVCTGRRHVYNISPPVTDPATNNLLFNYYPDNDDPASVVEALDDFADAQPAQFEELFETV